MPSAVYTWGATGLISERLTATNKSLWYAFGPQGETRQLTDSTGAVVDTYTYSPYGVQIASTGSDFNPFRYGGQAGYYTDANNPTGTILCGLRWYMPQLGRWLSRAPLSYDGGHNLYEYCNSNPIMGVDPIGLRPLNAFDLATLKKLWRWSDGSILPYQKTQAIQAIKAAISAVPNGSRTLLLYKLFYGG